MTGLRPHATLIDRHRASQAAVLASAIYDPQGAILYDRIEPRLFADEKLRCIWEDAKAARDTDPYSRFALEAHPLAGDGLADRLVSQWDEPDVAERRLRATAMLHDLALVGRQAAAVCDTTPSDIDQAEARVEELLRAVAKVRAEHRVRVFPASLMDAGLALIKSSLAEPSETLVTFGLPSLDRRLGGLRGGALAIVMGNSGHGKSTLALQAAVRAADAGIPVYYLSVEMEAEEILLRIVCSRLEVPCTLARAMIRDEDPAAIAALRWAERLPILVDSRARTMSECEARVAQGAGEGREFGLVVVDYLQQMRDPRHKARHEELEAIARDGKELAMRWQIPVVMAAQVNRSTDLTRTPAMTDVRGSSGIENAADVMISMRLATDGVSGYARRMELAIVKARNAQVGEILGHIQLGPGTFRVWESDSEEVEV